MTASRVSAVSWCIAQNIYQKGERRTMMKMENEMNVNVPLEVVKASEIEPKEVKWLWYPYIPFGKVTLLQGDPGDGKSKLMLSIAALLSKGEPLPFTETEEIEPMTIIYQTTEDDADDTVVPRFNSAGGNGENLIFIKEYEKYLSQIGKKVELISNPNKPDTITKMDDTLKANQTSSLMAYFKVYISDSKWQKFVLHYKNPTDRTTKVANGKIDRIILYNDHLQENPVKDELKTLQSITFSTDNGNLVMNNKSTSAHVMKIMGGAPQQNTDGYLIYNDTSGFVYNFATMNQKGTLTQFEIVYPRK